MKENNDIKLAQHLIKMVCKRRLNSTLLISEGGLGKSYHTLNTVKKHLKQKQWKYYSGHISPLRLYTILYKNQTKIIILDDIEQLLQSEVSVGILKSALWEVNGKRTVCYETTSNKADDLPERFNFKGGMVILCNKIPNQNDPVIKALKSRTAYLNIQLTYKQKINIIANILKHRTDLKPSEKNKILQNIKQHSTPATKLNIRTLEKYISYYKYDKEIADELLEATTEEDEEQLLILKMMKKGYKTKKQVKKWKKKTGKSRASYFRTKKKLKERM